MQTTQRKVAGKPQGRPRKAPAAPRAARTITKPADALQGPPAGFVEVEVLRAFSNHLAVKVHPGQVIRLPEDFAAKMLEAGMVGHV